MSSLKTTDKKILEKLFKMEGGYVLSFSDKSMERFFKDDFGISVYDAKYDLDFPSKSKANRLRGILSVEDSTKLEDVERLMDGKKADMVFTDPPYGVDYEGIKNDDRAGLTDLLRSVFTNYLANSKSGASIYCFHSDRCADIFNPLFREFFHFSSMIIWVKNSLTLSQTDYQSQHEPCLYGWMDNGTHSFYGDRKQTSIWKSDKERVAGHTTPKPIEIVTKAVSNSSKGDDIVLDLFLGSGSTLIASQKTGRICYGCELDERYCDVIVQRWVDYTGIEEIKKNGETIQWSKSVVKS